MADSPGDITRGEFDAWLALLDRQDYCTRWRHYSADVLWSATHGDLGAWPRPSPCTRGDCLVRALTDPGSPVSGPSPAALERQMSVKLADPQELEARKLRELKRATEILRLPGDVASGVQEP